MKRWVVAAGGILIQVCLGPIHAWSASTASFAAEPCELCKVRSQWRRGREWYGRFGGHAAVGGMTAGRRRVLWSPKRRLGRCTAIRGSSTANPG